MSETIMPICEHCGDPYQGQAYRVTSYEDGVILLDMVVCHECGLQARRLGLETRQLDTRYVAYN